MLQTLPFPTGISLPEQQTLVELARQAVWQAWRCRAPLQPVEEFYNYSLRRRQASLVTLRAAGERILTRSATVEPSVPLVCDVVHNAFEAAHHCCPDRPRVDAPLPWTIEVSAVSSLCYLNVESLDELLDRVLPAESHNAKAALESETEIQHPFSQPQLENSLEPHWIQPGVHGLLLRRGDRHASFPPDKWQTWPDANMFLWKLQQLAGIELSHWTPDTLVATYRVQTTPALSLDLNLDCRRCKPN